MLTLAAFVGSLVIVLMQTLYGLHVHRRIKQEENRLLSVTAHQMRTPLTAVRWSLQELGAKEIREDDRLELARMSDIAAQKLSNIIIVHRL